MSAINVTIKLDARLRRNLATLRSADRGRIVGTMAEAGGEVIREDAQRRAPVLTGRLRRSIEQQASQRSDSYAEDDIGPTDDVVYAVIQEYGGTIVPRNASLLRFEVNGRVVFARSVTLPAQPYMRPAADLNDGPIRKAVERKGWGAITRAVG